MLRAGLLSAALALLPMAPCPAAEALNPAIQPNIVLIVADDLGWADVPWHGSRARMPHLEKLAAQGVRLEAHYVHPMCSPTRAALLSGRYASRFGVTAAQNPRAFPWDTVTLASALRAAGYETALIGKWHLGSKPEEGPQKFGFDYSYGSLAGGVTPYSHRYKEGPFSATWHRNGQLVEEEGHVTDLIAREAVQWLERRDPAKPFLLYLPFTAIHVPMVETDHWLQANAHIADPAQCLRAAAASHMDDAIGQVLSTLEKKNVRQNTLVLFFGDNGAHRPGSNQGGPYPGDYGTLLVGNDNLPWRGHKSTVYEGGIRTPALAHWPGRLASGAVHTPVHAVDWMPTLCALAGAKSQGDLHWDGLDIWPALTGKSESLPVRAIYSAGVGFRSAALRYGDWKLVVQKRNPDASASGSSATEELFNLESDPGESKNLAAEKPEVLAEMKRRMVEISSRDREARVQAGRDAEQ